MLIVMNLLLDIAFAASAAHGDDSVPVMTIVAQIVNLSALILLIVFLTRKQVRAMFADRKAGYEVALQRARAAKEEAEARQLEILGQLKQVEDTFQEQLKKAEVKAEQVRQQMVDEAKQAAQRIKQETEATYRNEVNNAIMALKTELLQGSLATTEDLLKTKMQKHDHESLQDSLMKTIGAAK